MPSDRDAHREARGASRERRDDEAERLRGSRRGRHDVGPPRAHGGILVRRVEQPLVAGVRVHGRHQAVPDPDVSWSTFATGARQFVVHDALEMMWARRRSSRS